MKVNPSPAYVEPVFSVRQRFLQTCCLFLLDLGTWVETLLLSSVALHFLSERLLDEPHVLSDFLPGDVPFDQLRSYVLRGYFCTCSPVYFEGTSVRVHPSTLTRGSCVLTEFSPGCG